MTELDPLSVPLHGTHLVEAGAGTGKTHGLTALVLRMLVEGAVVPEQLALVTFTDAATRELRARARSRLALLAERLSGRAERSADEQVESLVAKHAGDDAARRRVDLARMTWDDATVATIHGFCRRLLGDFSLETGASFTDVEPIEGSLVLQRAVEDFWRRHVVSADPAQAAWVLSWCATPEALRELLAEPLRVPATNVIPDVGPADLDALERTMDALVVDGVRLQASGAITAVFNAFDGAKQLSRDQKKGYHPQTLVEVAGALAECFGGSGPASRESVPFAAVRTLTRASIIAGTKPSLLKDNWLPDPAAVLDWAGALCEAGARHARLRRVAFLRAALAEVRARLDQHRRERRIATFDDLVRDTAALLSGPAAARARDAIRARFRVAIVDEFQDTDAEQYAIFRALFHGRSDGALFLIGDPKQAIYRFRGGDVFAYRQAAEDAGANRWSLTANWRSDERLIAAVNGLFDDPARLPRSPFVHEFIGFERARFGEPRRKPPALPPAPQPLVVWTFDDGKLDKPTLNRRAEYAVAAEIARLRREFPDRRLRIAVLARTGMEVASCAAELARWRIASTQSSNANVFAGDEAAALRVVLEALADLRDVRKARAALATDLLGNDESALRSFAGGTGAWDRALAQLLSLADVAASDGPAALVRALAQFAGARWLAQADGSRRLATLVQVGEAMQCECGAGAGIAAQIALLDRRAGMPPSPDAELRPEAGTDVVELLTIHKSKGLEWDVVFAPYLWSGRDDTRISDPLRAIRPVRFHRETGGLVVDIGSDERDVHYQRALAESYAESIRIAYVALTRARCRAYTVWGSANTAQDSPFAWLLHQLDGAGELGLDQPPTVAATATRIAQWQAAADSALAVAALPEVGHRDAAVAEQPRALEARPFRGHIDRRFAMLSYSALFGEGSSEEQPDHDQRAPVLVVPEPGPVPDSPRGPRFGECVHTVLETFDFASPESQSNIALVEHVVRRRFGFDEDVEQYVIELAGSVARASPLGGATLGQLDRRQVELEFFFPLEDVDLGAVRDALALDPRYAREPAQFAGLKPRWHGLMHGYIDLVFADGEAHGLLDYKTNFIGGRYEDYEGEALARAVRAADYDLQYLIYSVALVRHLRRRLGARFEYETHFGGVSYLFLRGLEGGTGIFRDRPPRAVINALDRAFGGGR